MQEQKSPPRQKRIPPLPPFIFHSCCWEVTSPFVDKMLLQHRRKAASPPEPWGLPRSLPFLLLFAFQGVRRKGGHSQPSPEGIGTYAPQGVSACFYAHGRTVPYATTVFVCSHSNLWSWCSPLVAFRLSDTGQGRSCALAAGLAPCSFGGPCSGTLLTPITHPHPGLLPSLIREHGPVNTLCPKSASASSPSRVSDLHGGTPRSTHECWVCLPRGSCTPNRFAARHQSSPSLPNSLVWSHRERDSSALTVRSSY